ncbi:MAG TPA: Asp-tRNA(Asn)/Glu-tRNA(Gln) amidotransferase subunit GatA [Candidatus Paceibacterota bacterium]|nr:Asp-tRNA(Asn)/Glu-tRNA(Gln) amidotransferase subunit GatA [Candidatus Paceibacterota bacterium]
MPIDLEKMTIKDAREGLVAREFSATELAEAYLAAASEKDPEIHAYVEVFDDVKAQAKKADELIAEKKDDAPALAGIPIAMKDNILLKGRLASAGSKMLENYRAPYDSGVTVKLRDAGAVFLGRTNMDEFAMGSSTESSVYGATKNPHDVKRVPGGSSGGSAAAVASGTALAALGSDTGGSIRQPASFCGVVGLKPSYGAVSRSGLMAMASSLDQIGPFTKTVEDAEILFQALRGHDPLDSTSLPETRLQEKKEGKDRYTIGVPEKFLEQGVENDVLENFRENLKKLEQAGHTVREVSLPHIAYALSTYYIIMPAEVSSNLARYDGVKFGLSFDGADLSGMYKKTRAEGFGPEVRRRIMLGTYVLSAGYYDAFYTKALMVRKKITEDFENAFQNVDVIATPTTPSPAFLLGEKSGDPLAMYAQDIFTVPANIAGLPALSLPCGFVEREGKNLPLGLHLTAPFLREDVLFSVGKEF